jgi:hypothetical protein
MDIPDIDIVEDQTPLPEEEVYGFYKKNLGVILSCVVIFIAFLLQDSIGPDGVGGYGSVPASAVFLLPLESWVCQKWTNLGFPKRYSNGPIMASQRWHGNE